MWWTGRWFFCVLSRCLWIYFLFFKRDLYRQLSMFSVIVGFLIQNSGWSVQSWIFWSCRVGLLQSRTPAVPNIDSDGSIQLRPVDRSIPPNRVFPTSCVPVDRDVLTKTCLEPLLEYSGVAGYDGSSTLLPVLIECWYITVLCLLHVRWWLCADHNLGCICALWLTERYALTCQSATASQNWWND
jgi:hypothetical protein